jgi:hypothetical protein
MTMFEAQGKDVGRDWIFENVYATIDTAKTFLQTVRALTIPSNYCIDNLSADFKGTRGEVPYKDFQKDLKVIGKKINDRNISHKKKGNPVYAYLHPSNVPASIDI